LLFGLGVLHNLQAWRWTSSLGSATLRQVFQLEPNPAENTQFVFSKLPGDIRGVFFFQAGLSEGLQLVYDRDDIRGYRDTAPSAVAPQIRLEWNGDENSEILIRRE
jgi:hypothetical protein